MQALIPLAIKPGWYWVMPAPRLDNALNLYALTLLRFQASKPGPALIALAQRLVGLWPGSGVRAGVIRARVHALTLVPGASATHPRDPEKTVQKECPDLSGFPGCHGRPQLAISGDERYARRSFRPRVRAGPGIRTNGRPS